MASEHCVNADWAAQAHRQVIRSCRVDNGHTFDVTIGAEVYEKKFASSHVSRGKNVWKSQDPLEGTLQSEDVHHCWRVQIWLMGTTRARECEGLYRRVKTRRPKMHLWVIPSECSAWQACSRNTMWGKSNGIICGGRFTFKGACKIALDRELATKQTAVLQARSRNESINAVKWQTKSDENFRKRKLSTGTEAKR